MKSDDTHFIILVGKLENHKCSLRTQYIVKSLEIKL